MTFFGLHVCLGFCQRDFVSEKNCDVKVKSKLQSVAGESSDGFSTEIEMQTAGVGFERAGGRDIVELYTYDIFLITVYLGILRPKTMCKHVIQVCYVHLWTPQFLLYRVHQRNFSSQK